jgi:hypothetical protein
MKSAFKDVIDFEVALYYSIEIDIGRLSPTFRMTPPGVRIRTGGFGALSCRHTVNLRIPSESK